MKLFKRIKNWCWYKYRIVKWRKELMDATLEYNNNPTSRNKVYMGAVESHYYHLVEWFKDAKEKGLA